MAAYSYLLRYGSVNRYITSEDAIASGAILRLIPPADDRVAGDGFRIRAEDLVPMRVKDVFYEYHEKPTGGLSKVCVLTMEPTRMAKRDEDDEG